MGRTKILSRIVMAMVMVLILYGGAPAREVKSGVWKEIKLEPTADTYIKSSDHLMYRRLHKNPVNQINFGAYRKLSVSRGFSAFLGKHFGWRASLIRFDLSNIPPQCRDLGSESVSLSLHGLGGAHLHPPDGKGLDRAGGNLV